MADRVNNRFMCWPEDMNYEPELMFASGVADAAEKFVEGIEDEDMTRVCVSNERAERYIVELHVTKKVSASAISVTELRGDDLYPDDPMPTHQAEALRDAMRKEAPADG